VLTRQKQEGIKSQLAGFRMVDRAIARDHAPVYNDSAQVGHVTSGSHVPFLKQNIGLAMLPAELAKPGERIEIEIRSSMATAEIVSTPFYRRPKGSK
jgi:aminomethyltransferase